MDWVKETENLAFLVAALSLLVSFFFGFLGWRLQKRVVDLETVREREKRQKESRADLRAEVAQKMGNNGLRYVLRIANYGGASARNVRATIDEIEFLDHPVIPRGVKEVDVIGPQSKIDYPLAYSNDHPGPWRLDITWKDDSAEEGQYETTLTL